MRLPPIHPLSLQASVFVRWKSRSLSLSRSIHGRWEILALNLMRSYTCRSEHVYVSHLSKRHPPMPPRRACPSVPRVYEAKRLAFVKFVSRLAAGRVALTTGLSHSATHQNYFSRSFFTTLVRRPEFRSFLDLRFELPGRAFRYENLRLCLVIKWTFATQALSGNTASRRDVGWTCASWGQDVREGPAPRSLHIVPYDLLAWKEIYDV